MRTRALTLARRAGLVVAAAATILVAQSTMADAAGPAAAPARADGPDGSVEISQDGTTWSKDLVVDLFPTMRWVPGSAATTTLYIRSRACTQATAQAQVTVGPDGTQRTADLDATTRVDGGPWGGPTTSTFTLAAHQVATLDIELRHHPGSGNYSQARTAPVWVTVTVGCDGDLPGTADDDPLAVVLSSGTSTGSGVLSQVLASTGLDIVGAVAVAVAVSLLGGALVSARRRGARHA